MDTLNENAVHKADLALAAAQKGRQQHLRKLEKARELLKTSSIFQEYRNRNTPDSVLAEIIIAHMDDDGKISGAFAPRDELTGVYKALQDRVYKDEEEAPEMNIEYINYRDIIKKRVQYIDEMKKAYETLYSESEFVGLNTSDEVLANIIRKHIGDGSEYDGLAQARKEIQKRAMFDSARPAEISYDQLQEAARQDIQYQLKDHIKTSKGTIGEPELFVGDNGRLFAKAEYNMTYLTTWDNDQNKWVPVVNTDEKEDK